MRPVAQWPVPLCRLPRRLAVGGSWLPRISRLDRVAWFLQAPLPYQNNPRQGLALNLAVDSHAFNSPFVSPVHSVLLVSCCAYEQHV
jgi:hypothetical protein